MNFFRMVGSLASNIVLLCLFYACFLSYYNNGVEGTSVDDDIEIEKQLKILNKPAVFTIQSKHGELYDCVDFYKQPAFDHPMLQNHSFFYQMKPSSPPKMPRQKEPITNKITNQVSPLTIGCPFGTVPIRRVTKQDLIRANLNSEAYNKGNKGSKFSVLTNDDQGIHVAQCKTANTAPYDHFNGGGATFFTTQPPNVLNNQYSSVRIKLSKGSDNIQAGWTVNPDLYGNFSTRLYLYTETSGSKCFNTQCPGFILVSDVPFDTPLSLSQGAGVGDTLILIYRDAVNGNWWLEYEQRGSGDRRTVGFWPPKIFTGLVDYADNIEYGGEVSTPRSKPSPPMGNGLPLRNDMNYDAYVYNILAVYEGHNLDEAHSLNVNHDDAYQVTRIYVDDGRYNQQVILYGGPGGFVG